MKEAFAVFAILAPCAVVGVSVAVTDAHQASHIGTSCPPGTKWYFANNQTGGAARGKLTSPPGKLVLSDSCESTTTPPAPP
jgi:hypothetical protein